MGYALFLFWTVVLSWCITRSGFVRRTELGTRWVVGIFLCKIAAGLFMGRLSQNAVPLTDTWAFHRDGLLEYQLLFTHPGEYCTNLFHSIYQDKYAGVFVARNSYWNDLRGNLMAKMVSVLDIFSFGRYYVNVVLFNFLVFFGNMALYKALARVFSQRSAMLVIACFLLPSFILYTSTIHKDGLILAAIGVIIYGVQRMMHQKVTLVSSMSVLVSFLLIFLFRNLVALALLPALLAFVIATKSSRHPLLVFTTIYAMALLLFFSLAYVMPALNFPAFVAQRQLDFLSLGKANTSIPVHPLSPTITSFAVNAPQALLHSLARPYPADFRLSAMLLPFILELMGYLALLVWFVFRSTNYHQLRHPLVLFGIFFTLSVCLVIGYTIPILGAIIRYRAIYLPFLLAPMLYCIRWPNFTSR